MTTIRRRQERRDTAANWTTVNPTLAAGEWGVDTTTYKVKLGNGTTPWVDLAFFGVDSAAVTAEIDAAVDAAVAGVIDAAPGALDTLNELAAALGDDANFAGTVTTALAALPETYVGLPAVAPTVGQVLAAIDTAVPPTTDWIDVTGGSGGGLAEWAAVTAYTEGDTIINADGDVVAAKENHTSGAAYNPDKWARTFLRHDHTGIPGTQVTGMTVTGSATALPCGVVGGVVYGRGAADGSKLYSLGADGETWTHINTIGTGSAIGAIRLLGDGEAFAITTAGAYKSTGWATNPATATWALKQAPTPNTLFPGSPAGAFVPFGFDVWDNLVLLTEYAVPRENSVKVWLSTDYGATFAVVRDLTVLYPGQDAAVHWHGVGIDPWAGTPSGSRLWCCHGDGPRVIFYSDDLGATWTTFSTTEQPTTITATPAGVVFGTDTEPDGLARVLRTGNPANMVYEGMVYMRFADRPGGGLYGNANLGWRDPTTNVVYVAFPSQVSGVPSVVFATDGVTGHIIYTSSLAVTDYRVDAAYVLNDTLYIETRTFAGDQSFGRGGAVRRGSGPNILSGADIGYADRHSVGIGNAVSATTKTTIIGANATSGPRGVAIGQAAVAASAGEAVAIGQAASVTGTYSVGIGQGVTVNVADSVVVGRGASVGAANSTAIGRLASASGGSCVAVGYGASATSTASVAVGLSAVATGANACSVGGGAASNNQGTAIGRLASATGVSDAVALGKSSAAAGGYATALGGNSVASAAYTVALGASAQATHQNSVAIGRSTTTTVVDQVAMGARHIEVTELAADPAAPAANNARLYTKDVSTKTQLGVRFATGLVQPLAEEGAPRRLWGAGTPEANVIGSPGDTYQRSDGGAGTCFYVKESGAATNTGWVAK